MYIHILYVDKHFGLLHLFVVKAESFVGIVVAFHWHCNNLCGIHAIKESKKNNAKCKLVAFDVIYTSVCRCMYVYIYIHMYSKHPKFFLCVHVWWATFRALEVQT